MCEFTAKDYKKGQPRWCPGCGDHFFLASLHKAMAEIGVAPWDIAVISGIGCSSRLPHYMNTYGMNKVITTDSKTVAIARHLPNSQVRISHLTTGSNGSRTTVDGVHTVSIHIVRQTAGASDT